MSNLRRKREHFRAVMSGKNEICATFEERMKTFIRLVLYMLSLRYIGLWVGNYY